MAEVLEEKRNENGNLHCEDGPAIVRRYEDGSMEYEYYNDGRKHRLDGPAIDGPNSTEYWVEGQPHRDGGPSIIYHKGDDNGNGVGQTLFHLHGVIVPQNIAEATDANFDHDWFYKEKNVEVRREIIRKFGLERIVKIVEKGKLKIGEGRILDTEEGYELWYIRLTKETYGNYLKMQNPSVPDVWHLEGVSPNCKTVKDALEWRNHGLKGNPKKLT